MARGQDAGRNKAEILRYFMDHQEVSRSEIVKALDLSMPTVMRYTNELALEGILLELGPGESTGGRKAGLYKLNERYRLAAGIDITANHICFVLVNMRREAVAVSRYRCRYAHTMEYYQTMAHAMEEFFSREGVCGDTLLGIGMSFPGIVDKKNRILTYSHALELRKFNLASIQKLFPWPLRFENDAVSGAMSEWWSGKRDMIYLSLSNTVGGAICLNGSIYEGDNFKSAEFGHMLLHPGGRKCYCRKKGCVDAYCNAALLAEYTDGNLEKFFALVREGEEEAAERWRLYLNDLALVISNLRMAFDCEIVLGGYVGGFLEPYILELEALVAENNKFEEDAGYIRACRYRYEAAGVGGAAALIDQFTGAF